MERLKFLKRIVLIFLLASGSLCLVVGLMTAFKLRCVNMDDVRLIPLQRPMYASLVFQTHTLTTKNRISEANKGKSSWNKGKNHTAETRLKISNSNFQLARNKLVHNALTLGLTTEEFENMKATQRVLTYTPRCISEQGRQKLSQSSKRRWELYRNDSSLIPVRTWTNHSIESRKKISESLKRHYVTSPQTRAKRGPEAKQRISESLKKKWTDVQFRFDRKKRGNMTETHKMKLSESIREVWARPGFKERMSGLSNKAATAVAKSSTTQSSLNSAKSHPTPRTAPKTTAKNSIKDEHNTDTKIIPKSVPLTTTPQAQAQVNTPRHRPPAEPVYTESSVLEEGMSFVTPIKVKPRKISASSKTSWSLDQEGGDSEGSILSVSPRVIAARRLLLRRDLYYREAVRSFQGINLNGASAKEMFPVVDDYDDYDVDEQGVGVGQRSAASRVEDSGEGDEDQVDDEDEDEDEDSDEVSDGEDVGLEPLLWGEGYGEAAENSQSSDEEKIVVICEGQPTRRLSPKTFEELLQTHPEQ